MLPVRDLIDIAQGDGPSAELVAARQALDRRTRRHVQRAVRRGEALRDGPSARYAVALAQAELDRAASLQRNRMLLLLLAFGGPIVALGAWGRGERTLTVFAVLLAIACAHALATVGRRQRRAEATVAANASLAPATTASATQTVEITTAERFVGLVGVGVFAAAIAAVVSVVDSGHSPELEAAVGYGVIAALVTWWMGRKASGPPATIEIPAAPR